jgi:hypothetical protein
LTPFCFGASDTGQLMRRALLRLPSAAPFGNSDGEGWSPYSIEARRSPDINLPP